MPSAVNVAVAGEQHARHRGDDRQAGDQHGAARRGRGDGQRVLRAARPRAAPRAHGAGRTASSRRRRPCRRAGRPTRSCRPSATSWLTGRRRPSVAATAVRPSSSGTPAATSAPKASTRMTSVIGTESFSALWKSSEKAFDERRCSPTRRRTRRRARPGGARRCAATSAIERLDRLLRRAVVAGQLEGHDDRAAVLGDLALVAGGVGRVDVGARRGSRRTPRDDVADGRADLGACGRSPGRRPWIRTDSVVPFGVWSSMSWSALAEPPVPPLSSGFCVP